MVSLGISGSLEKAKRVHARLAPVASLASEGAVRVGMGDDWPLWVPERRRRAGVTEGFDEAHLEKIRQHVFGETAGLPETPVTILYCQEPEISASNPGHSSYRKEVHDLMRRFRDQLLANDKRIFGGGS